MTREEALTILNAGSMRDKIKLYFTDVAYFNIKGIHTLESTPSKDINRVDYLLSDTERDSIYNSIKEKKDIRYYESLRIANTVFVNSLDKDLDIYTKDIELLTSQIAYASLYDIIRRNYPKDLSLLKFTENQSKNWSPVMRKYKEQKAQRMESEDSITILVSELNETTAEAKHFITGVKLFFKERLPISIYREYLKEYENKIVKSIEQARELLKAINREQEIPRYKDVKVVLTESDINDIRAIIN